MKITITLVFILLVFSSSITAQNYTWFLKQSGNSLGGPIDVERDNSDNVYYGSVNIIYKSTDRGETFSQYGSLVPQASRIKSVILNDDISGTLLVAIESTGSDKILKSTDSGATWLITANGMNFSFFGIPMTPDPSHPDTIYTMSNSSFLRSSDFGSTWDTLTNNVGCATPCDIEVFKDTSIILIGDNATGIFKSTDYGNTWSQVFSTSGEIPTVAIDHNNPGTAWATKWSGGGGVLKSTDYGSTWTHINQFNSINMWGVTVNPFDGDEVHVGCYSCGNTWRTKDGGTIWESINISSTNYQLYVVDSMTVFSAQGAGFYKLESPFFIPVELTSFTASIEGSKIILNWETATELNNQGFDIEHSSDGNIFTSIGFVPGFGSTTEQKNYSFVVDVNSSKKNYFRLKQLDFNGDYEYSSLVEVDGVLPNEFELFQNFPNPFNPSTKITFALPVEANIQIKLFNSLGEEIFEISHSQFTSGVHEVEFNASELASGNYIYKIQATGIDGRTFSSTKKMSLIK